MLYTKISNEKQSIKAIKISFILIVHGNPVQINLFLKQLLSYQHSYIYIYVDVKYLEIIPKLLKNERIMIAPKYFNIK